jgi:hypothetical protein
MLLAIFNPKLRNFDFIVFVNAVEYVVIGIWWRGGEIT